MFIRGLRATWDVLIEKEKINGYLSTYTRSGLWQCFCKEKSRHTPIDDSLPAWEPRTYVAKEEINEFLTKYGFADMIPQFHAQATLIEKWDDYIRGIKQREELVVPTWSLKSLEAEVLPGSHFQDDAVEFLAVIKGENFVYLKVNDTIVNREKLPPRALEYLLREQGANKELVRLAAVLMKFHDLTHQEEPVILDF